MHSLFKRLLAQREHLGKPVRVVQLWPHDVGRPLQDQRRSRPHTRLQTILQVSGCAQVVLTVVMVMPPCLHWLDLAQQVDWLPCAI